MSTVDLPGFADPVAQSQATFRAVLEAIAHPGRIVALPVRTEAPAPLNAGAAAVALTVLDFETPVWLDDALMPAASWLQFHCGAPLVAQGAARFAFCAALPPLSAFAQGSAEFPETSATIILQAAGLGCGHSFTLQGPGIAGSTALAVDGLPDDLAAQWRENGALYPCGVDIVLVTDDAVAALPRTVRMAEGS